MDAIYHEKQQAALCGVHCLNALLQRDIYTAVDLSALAVTLDQAEERRMAEQGTDTQAYRDYLREGSNNMDDSGMFSVQVLTAALENFSLSIIPFTSTVNPSACSARDDPTTANAYICNMREHWFTIRRIGYQWFNLNSLLDYPELLSNTYLSLFLTQLQTEGYCIYLVEGTLDECTADPILRACPATQRVKPRQAAARVAGRSSREEEDDNGELAAALAASLASDDSDELERAKQISLTEHLTAVPYSPPPHTPREDLERAMALSLEEDRVSVTAAGSNETTVDSSFNDENEQLRKALCLSMQQEGGSNSSGDSASSPPLTDAETLRQKRLLFFQNKDKQDQP